MCWQPAFRPFTGSLENRRCPFNGEELLAAVLHYQYAPVFWYLYQLMFLILLSPVLYWIIKNRTRGLVFLAAVMAAVHFIWIPCIPTPTHFFTIPLGSLWPSMAGN